MASSDVPLLLLHGTGVDSRMWARFVDELGSDVPVLDPPDLLGHGDTPRPNRPLHIDDYVRQVRKEILRSDAETVRVVGHSLGGITALALAVQHPDLVESALLIGVPFGRDDETQNRWLDRIMAVGDEEDTEAAAEELANRWCPPGSSATDEVRQLLASMDPKTFGLVFRIAMTTEPEIAEMAAEATVPVGVVCGDCDAEVGPEGVEALAAAVTDGWSAVVPAHFHLSILEDPAPYLELLDRL